MPKSTLKEGDIIRALKEALPDGQVVRFTPGPASPRGISDVLITWSCKEYFCEIKVNDTKLTTLQAAFLSKRANPILMHVDTRKGMITCEVRGEQAGPYWIALMLVKKLYKPESCTFGISIIEALRY